MKNKGEFVAGRVKSWVDIRVAGMRVKTSQGTGIVLYAQYGFSVTELDNGRIMFEGKDNSARGSFNVSFRDWRQFKRAIKTFRNKFTRNQYNWLINLEEKDYQAVNYWGGELNEVEVLIKPVNPMAPPSSYHTVVDDGKITFHKTGTAPQEDVTRILNLVTGEASKRYYQYDVGSNSYYWAVEEVTAQGAYVVKKEASGEVVYSGTDIKKYSKIINDMKRYIEFSYTSINPDAGKAALLKPVADYLAMVEGKL